MISPSSSYQTHGLYDDKNRQDSGKSIYKVNHTHSKHETLEGMYFSSIRSLSYNIDLTTRKSMEKDSLAAVLQNNTGNLETPKSNSKVKHRTKRRLENVKINLFNCKYDVIKNVTTDKKFGFGWKQESQTQELTSASKLLYLDFLAPNNWDVYW